MNVNVINPFLAAGSELFKENEGKNVIVERPRLCIKFDDPGVQFASLIRFFDPKFKGGLLFAYSEKMRFSLKNWAMIWQNSINSCKYIVRLHGTYWNRPEGSVSLIMDHMSGGSL